jgi:hypothetical protein
MTARVGSRFGGSRDECHETQWKPFQPGPLAQAQEEQHRRHLEAELLGGAEVDHQLELGRRAATEQAPR